MSRVANVRGHEGLERRKESIEQELRSRYAGYTRSSLMAMAPLDVYCAYFRQFDKTYHVLMQLESVAFKGKGLPSTDGAVEAMFMAELSNLLLTAGHDQRAIQGEILVDVSTGDEQYVKMNGQPQRLTPRDMKMSDAESVISCVLHGPDRRTRITPESTDLLFAVYAPPGLDPSLVRSHLQDIRDNVLMFAPGATTEALTVVG